MRPPRLEQVFDVVDQARLAVSFYPGIGDAAAICRQLLAYANQQAAGGDGDLAHLLPSAAVPSMLVDGVNMLPVHQGYQSV